MKSSFIARASAAALALAPVLLLTACAGSKPAPTGAASVTQSGQTGAAQANAQPKAPATTGTVSISEEIRKACGIADQDAYFAFDSSTILSTDISPLNTVARCFTEGPLKGRSMRLVGHADPRGTEEYNMTLGQNRADSVQSYLDRHGVRSSQIATTSRGAIDASGHDAAGWATDRRVDVMLGS
jgi:peptidoglycan-associated lipoprotein